jgi:hypothetical protein
MANQKPPELSMTASVVILLIGAVCLLGMIAYKKNTAKPAVVNKELRNAMQQLKAKQNDPRVKACSDAAWSMGKTFRQQGRIKPSDAELHAMALAACDHMKVPVDMRGVAVEKFKSSFGWGWSSAP